LGSNATSNIPGGIKFKANRSISCKVFKLLRQSKVLKSILKDSFSSLTNLGGTETEQVIQLLDFDNTIEILALLYLNAGETVFNYDTYLERLKEFENLTNADWIGDLIADFFTVIPPSSIIQSSLIFLTAMQKA
jgi:hypothetical protein